MKIMVCILLAGLSVTSAFLISNVNDYDAPMDFSCTGNTTLRSLSSTNNNHYEDRVWSMGCYPAVATVQNCQWTGYVNEFDQPFDYECPGDGFINGVRSIHSNHNEDRRWAFQCCEMQGRIRHNCHDTGFVNTYDGGLSYSTAHNYQNFHGWISIHDNHPEDRIFDFQVCDYVEGETSGYFSPGCSCPRNNREPSALFVDEKIPLTTYRHMKGTGISREECKLSWPLDLHYNWPGEPTEMGAFSNRKMMVCILLAGLSLTSAFIVNNYDRHMAFSCPEATTLRHLSSVHDNHHEDRVWTIGCYPAVARVQNCQWTGYVNEFDRPFVFECPGEGFINGIRSFHSNRHEDRKWAFQCCEMQDLFKRNCRNTGFVNSYDGGLSYTTAHAYQNFHGWTSIHDNHHEDRLFSFQVCNYEE
ncbi:uncharacterized protein LOC110466804 [Mizuhopecten yessoensis]|uniref:uncharacterized protein LOC110466804 n=1 Tax=Mizuhopecten yessoensis TaxID=6573 RepID=UPI000B45DCD6|nr:uncharacterized protein LOC110466804 [Mizuhopecten yessoensis]